MIVTSEQTERREREGGERSLGSYDCDIRTNRRGERGRGHLEAMIVTSEQTGEEKERVGEGESLPVPPVIFSFLCVWL